MRLIAEPEQQDRNMRWIALRSIPVSGRSNSALAIPHLAAAEKIGPIRDRRNQEFVWDRQFARCRYPEMAPGVISKVIRRILIAAPLSDDSRCKYSLTMAKEWSISQGCVEAERLAWGDCFRRASMASRKSQLHLLRGSSNRIFGDSILNPGELERNRPRP
jgi:hypothetical protein